MNINFFCKLENPGLIDHCFLIITDHNHPYYLGGSPRAAVEIVLERDVRRNQFGTVKNDIQQDCNTEGLSILRQELRKTEDDFS